MAGVEALCVKRERNSLVHSKDGQTWPPQIRIANEIAVIQIYTNVFLSLKPFHSQVQKAHSRTFWREMYKWGVELAVQ